MACICRDCAILEHRDHNFVSIDKGLDKKRSEIETKMGDVLANGSRLRKEKEFLKAQRLRMSESIEKAKEEVHRVAEANFPFVNGRCHLKWSMPFLGTVVAIENG